MDILRIKHRDFTLNIECEVYSERHYRGMQLLGGADHLTSTYHWTDGVEWVKHLNNFNENNPDSIGAIHADDPNEGAYFFEQTDYTIWAEFPSNVTDVEYINPRKDLKEHFKWRGAQHILMGYLNYGNEIGRADFEIAYTINGRREHFVFSYDVISTKLDYHRDWKVILRDIEEEYRMLSLDYLRQTYHGISQGDGESLDLIWWNIFKELQREYMTACRNIIERPRHRLRAISTYKRADQIRRFTPILEQQFMNHCEDASYHYFVEEQQTTHNTIENRFLKHTLQEIHKRYHELASRILEKLKLPLDDSARAEIKATDKQLETLLHNPFFRTIGKYEGLKQESLILQRDINYSKIYRTSVLLRKSFNLNDGLFRMETKDIATLYEIWCFIQVEKVVKDLFGKIGKTNVRAEHINRQELHGLFTRELATGNRSRIVFKDGDVTLAELYYNPRHDERTDDIRGINDLQSYTVVQKPDIVLQLTKDDIQRGMNLTYLFDAKYRISEKDGREVPPDDAINQMHRYRDAIYYSQPHEKLRKEVLGGYILFPGKMDRNNPLYKSVEQVNIGAFPLRPGDQEFAMLREFIRDLMMQNAVEIVEQVIPQKGTTLEVPDKVFVGVVPEKNAAPYEDRSAVEYHTGHRFPQTIPLNEIHWFVPYLSGKGARDLYRVKTVHTGLKDESSPDDNLRIAMDVEYVRPLYADYKQYPASTLTWEMFLYTTIGELEKL